MAGKPKTKTKRVNRSPYELMQAEYEKSQLRAIAADDGYMDALVSQGAPPSPFPGF
jgi:hypothetical protein